MIALDDWAKRQARCDRITELARGFFDAGRGESAGWCVTGWPRPIVAGSDIRQCREWLTCRADPGRMRAFHDLLGAERLISSTSTHGTAVSFTPR